MKSFTKLKSLFTTLSQNSSTENDTLGGILINDQHRYLLLRFFDNERTVYLSTVGPQDLTLTGTLSSGAKIATLSSAWTGPTCQQLVVFSNSEQRTVFFTENSTSITWNPALTSSATADISTMGVQAYPLPANVSKVKNSTITIGQLVYSPAPVQSVQEWTKLNALPYNSSIPAYFFIYNGQINFWPIPSSSGDVISINCKTSVPDMTYTDYTTPGTIATMTSGSNQIVGNGTTWASSFPAGVDLTFANLYFSPTPTGGDGLYYQIQSITDNTHLTLIKPIINAPATGGAMTIGQYPLLSPDFHDMIVYGALRIYFSSINKDSEKYALFNGLFAEKTSQMEHYLANKQVNVDLGASPTQSNPNLYIFAQQ